MAASKVMSSLALKPSPLIERAQANGIPSLARSSSALKVRPGVGKKIKTDTPYRYCPGQEVGWSCQMVGVARWLELPGGLNPSPIYTPEEWSLTGDVYVGGTTGLWIWVATLAGLLLGGTVLVYTSALAKTGLRI